MNKTFTLMLCIAITCCTQCGKRKTQAEIDGEIIDSYLAKHQLTAIKTASGLRYIITSANTAGTQAKAGMTAYVRYTGKFMDELVFDDNISSATPFSYVIGSRQVIKGWDEGVALMRSGEKARFFIPSGLAYGTIGQGVITPNSVLQYEMNLVDLK